MRQERHYILISIIFLLIITPFIIAKSSIYYFLITLFFSYAVSLLSYKLKFLDFKGTSAIFSLSLIILGLGGINWTMPILVFFIFSSILSKIKRKNLLLSDLHLEVHSSRNHIQVFSNGGFGGVLAILNYFFPSELFYVVFVSSIAAVCADTWSTEIGAITQSAAVNILTLRLVEPGVSGGVSLAGTIGGILGAIVIALSSLFWLDMKHFYFVIFIIFAGIIGNIFDSVMGASVQAKFRCNSCSSIVEKPLHCQQAALLVKGYKWINNDMVNLATAVIGGLFGFLFIEIF